MRDMVRGMQGADVRALQQGLNEYFGHRRPQLSPDGDFGSRTLAAVNAFQEENPGTGKQNGQPDGIAGFRTLRRLFPLVGYTVNAYLMRLKMPDFRPRRGIRPPNLGPGPLRPPGTPLPGPHINPQPAPQVDWMRLLPGMLNAKLDFKPTTFPGLAKPLSVPPPRLLSTSGLPTLPSLFPRQFQIPLPRQFELGVGGTFATGKPPEATASLSVSAVYVMGDFIPHYEFQTGFEVGTPNANKPEGWTVGWFAQFAAVDFFWKYGRFHLAQPYAQLGVDATSKGMVLKGNVSPVNIDLDITNGLSINFQSGVVASWNLANGEFQGPASETSIGINVTTEIFDP